VSLVIWKLEGNLLLLAKIFSFFLYNVIVYQCLVSFTAVLQDLVALQQRKLGSQKSCFQTSLLKILAKPKARHNSKSKWLFSTVNMDLSRMS